MPSVFPLILKGHKQSADTGGGGGMLLLPTQPLSVNLALVHLGSERESEGCSVMSNSLWPHGLYCPCNSSGQNTGVGSLSLLQGIFPTQQSNPDLPHCRGILYQLSHKGSPRRMEWVVHPSPVDLPVPGMEPGSPALQVDSLPTELWEKPLKTTTYWPPLKKLCDSGKLFNFSASVFTEAFRIIPFFQLFFKEPLH